jgi:hypothetical protein
MARGGGLENLETVLAALKLGGLRKGGAGPVEIQNWLTRNGSVDIPGPTSRVPATGGWAVQAREREV